jgi:hypothetical protein
VAVLAALASAGLPWGRLSASHGRTARLEPDADTHALLSAVAALPADSLVAAAPGFAELVPAAAARAVLAFSDRGTVAFAGSRAAAEDRLVANAALIGLHGWQPRLRRRLIQRHGVTHVVYERAACDLGMRAVARRGRLTLCEAQRRGNGSAGASAPALLVADTKDSGSARVLASRSAGTVHCAGDGGDRAFRWRRGGRWSANYATATCTVAFAQPEQVEALRVRLHLPRAREAVVFAVRARGQRRCVRTGALVAAGEQAGRVELRCGAVRRLRVRLVPAFLPYLSLTDVEVLGARFSAP